jgi:hypothetical protein
MKMVFCLLALLLTGCAGPKSTIDVEASKREWEANFTDRMVAIHSAPSGAIVDLNGDVIGTTPFVYDLKSCYRGSWPANGHIFQTLRARWLDGTALVETHPTTSTPPKTVLFMHPNARDYMQAPAALNLTHR